MTPYKINFRSLLEEDLEMLFNWLNQAHMRQHYQKVPVSLKDVRQKYLPRISDTHPTHCHIALLDGKPIGKIQSYLVRDYEDFSTIMETNKGVGVDLFIGEENCLGRGIGQQMLRTYVSDIVKELFPEEQICFICHAGSNKAAIKCSTGAGFKHLRKCVEDGEQCTLLAIEF